MIDCQNCGKENDFGTNFCRFCGNRFTFPQTQQANEFIAPRPYMWKTDEFQVDDKSARKTKEIKQVQPFYQPNFNPNPNQGLVNPQPHNFVSGYRCPRCGTTNLPYTKRQVSTAGWITFAVLLVTTGIFFWIGLLIREDAKICSICNCKIS